MKKRIIGVVLIIVIFASACPAFADKIFVIRQNTSHSAVNYLIENLKSIVGNDNLKASNYPLSSYDGYDQVWDLRYESTITAKDTKAFTDFLNGGGRMYITGEYETSLNPQYKYRNNSVESFLMGIDAVYNFFDISGYANKGQNITDSGQIINRPNYITSIQPGGTSKVDGISIKNGFLVSEDPDTPGRGSLVAWDFNDLADYPEARLLVGLDVDFFTTLNCPALTQNLYTFLSGSTAPVPVPAAVWFFVTGLAGLGIIRKKKDKKLAP